MAHCMSHSSQCIPADNSHSHHHWTETGNDRMMYQCNHGYKHIQDNLQSACSFLFEKGGQKNMQCWVYYRRPFNFFNIHYAYRYNWYFCTIDILRYWYIDILVNWITQTQVHLHMKECIFWFLYIISFPTADENICQWWNNFSWKKCKIWGLVLNQIYFLT